MQAPQQFAAAHTASGQQLTATQMHVVMRRSALGRGIVANVYPRVMHLVETNSLGARQTHLRGAAVTATATPTSAHAGTACGAISSQAQRSSLRSPAIRELTDGGNNGKLFREHQIRIDTEGPLNSFQ